MKYIKKYESLDEIPKIGDYVIIKTSDKQFSQRYNDFIRSHVAVVQNKEKAPWSDYGIVYYYVTFVLDPETDSEEIFNEFSHIQSFKLSDIKDFDEDKEALLLRLEAEKYNL